MNETTARPVRVRFAPAPTGFLHLGGVRTALFNWLFARRHGGRFILRIDDTDRGRNVEAALEPILDGLRWLGLDWDEGPGAGGDHGPYFQSERAELHRDAVERLLAGGHAYYDYARPEELAAERAEAEGAGRDYRPSRRWAAKTPEERARFESEGREGAVVRLEMPREGVCEFTDAVRGEMSFEWSRENDHAVQRADGSVLYHLASAVDDDAMEISHVIRAEEHLSNTPRQIFIARALAHEPPVYAHLPYVAEPGSRQKLSKRKLDKYLKHAEFARLHERGRRIADAAGLDVEADTFNPVVVDFYRRIGYLPEALVNYLVLLGWSLDDSTEFFSRDEMTAQFSLERVGKSPSSFDPIKLDAFQQHYMREQAVPDRSGLAVPFLEAAGLVGWPQSHDELLRVQAVLAAAGDRIVVAGDILEYAEFFVADADLAYDEKAFDKRLRKPAAAAGLLAAFRDELATATFEAAALEELLRAYCERREVKLGAVIHALRVAVTGKAVGFGMFETLEILGASRTLERIERALKRLEDGE